MKKTILLVIALVLTTNIVTTTAVTKYDVGLSTPRTSLKMTPQGVLDVKMKVYYYSQKYGVEIEKLTYIVENESHYKTDAIGDMNITCKKTGQPVRARGILQITDCYYPEIPDSCAFDVDCSIREMIHLIKDDKTCYTQWTTCRNYLKYGI